MQECALILDLFFSDMRILLFLISEFHKANPDMRKLKIYKISYQKISRVTRRNYLTAAGKMHPDSGLFSLPCKLFYGSDNIPNIFPIVLVFLILFHTIRLLSLLKFCTLCFFATEKFFLTHSP